MTDIRRAIWVPLRTGGEGLAGDLAVPEGAMGVVAFAHGSGSSRRSPRNRVVAEGLRSGGLGTLLIDLLTPAEEAVDLRTRHLRFDIPLLAHRMIRVVDWLRADADTAELAVGLFGASTGAAAALIAAAERPEAVRAVVSRGGRPDLADSYLPVVRAPTLLVIGAWDAEVIALNREAAASMVAHRSLSIVPGATHLFEEPGTLEEVARLARAWFVEHLSRRRPGEEVRATHET